MRLSSMKDLPIRRTGSKKLFVNYIIFVIFFCADRRVFVLYIYCHFSLGIFSREFMSAVLILFYFNT